MSYKIIVAVYCMWGIMISTVVTGTDTEPRR